MVLQNSHIRVIAIRIVYLIGIAIAISILANLFAFFSTSDILSEVKVEKVTYSTAYHVPQVDWDQPSIANGRLLEKFDNSHITRAYSNAWYFLNQALRNKSAVGLEDFFADHLIVEIKKIILADNNYSEERVDLNHDIELYLFSLDKQVIAFKDKNIRIKRKVFHNQKFVYEEEIFKSYEIVMTVADGKWRILQMKEIENESSTPLVKFTPHFVLDSTITFVNTESAAARMKVNCKQKAEKGFHKIKAGETLFSLSQKYQTSVKQLKEWNKIKNSSDIKVCSHLRIKPLKNARKKIVLVTARVQKSPNEKNRIVKQGETIFTIAKELKIQPSILQKTNGIADQKLKAGQVISIPDLNEVNRSKIENIKGINYYPQASPWLEFWMEYDSKIIRKDLLSIKKLGMNTVRVFVPSDGVVPGLQFSVMMDKLESLLNECVEMELDAVVTLFDFPVSFDLDYYTRSEKQLEDLLTRFKTHPAIFAWDLKNEPDLDFERHGKKKVMQWLEYLIERARVYDPNHLLTIGWSSPEAAVNHSRDLDFVSFHYYRDPKMLTLDMLKLKQAVNNKPILLGEFGIPSNKKWYKPMGYSKEEQSDYLSKMKREMEINEIPYLLWTLHDFDDIPTEVFGYKKWFHAKQKYFGLLDRNGKKKPAYHVFAPSKK